MLSPRRVRVAACRSAVRRGRGWVGVRGFGSVVVGASLGVVAGSEEGSDDGDEEAGIPGIGRATGSVGCCGGQRWIFP